jgi:hypothetical protein
MQRLWIALMAVVAIPAAWAGDEQAPPMPSPSAAPTFDEARLAAAIDAAVERAILRREQAARAPQASAQPYAQASPQLYAQPMPLQTPIGFSQPMPQQSVVALVAPCLFERAIGRLGRRLAEYDRPRLMRVPVAYYQPQPYYLPAPVRATPQGGW